MLAQLTNLNPHTTALRFAHTSNMMTAGQVANQHATANIFDDYRHEQALKKNTLKAHGQALTRYAAYLAAAGVIPAADVSDTAEALYATPTAWRGTTHGLVKGFRNFEFNEGQALKSINDRLSVVKVYCALAFTAGVIPEGEHAAIRLVKGYRLANGADLNKQREISRVGDKKETAVVIPAQAARNLLDEACYSSDATGARDFALMAVAILHGLRVSELAALTVGNVDLDAGIITFARPKVSKVKGANVGKHELMPAAWRALAAWLAEHPAADDPGAPLFLASRKGGHLERRVMSVRAINSRVRFLGAAAGVDGLSPHDLRHFAASDMATKGYPINQLMDWFGWTNPTTALKYIHAAEVQKRDRG
jgi:integrase